MEHDYGPLRTYRVTWRSGRTQRIQAHQVSYSGGLHSFDDSGPRHIRFHGMFDGKWLLVLDVESAQLRSAELLPLRVDWRTRLAALWRQFTATPA